MSQLKALFPKVYSLQLKDEQRINAALLQAFERAEQHGQLKGSHYFGERFENLYIKRREIPEIQQILDQAILATSHIINEIPSKVKVNFWFNKMQPGQETLPHSHDDWDERISAVYYVRVPDNSGSLILSLPAENGETQEATVAPEEGKLVLFPPDMEHRVSKNLSNETRLSIGMNLGTGDMDLD